jgi:hypothetical protein
MSAFPTLYFRRLLKRLIKMQGNDYSSMIRVPPANIDARNTDSDGPPRIPQGGLDEYIIEQLPVPLMGKKWLQAFPVTADCIRDESGLRGIVRALQGEVPANAAARIELDPGPLLLDCAALPAPVDAKQARRSELTSEGRYLRRHGLRVEVSRDDNGKTIVLLLNLLYISRYKVKLHSPQKTSIGIRNSPATTFFKF